MNYVFLVIIGLLAGVIVSKSFLLEEPAQPASTQVRGETIQSSEDLEALIADIVEARDELALLLETEREKYANLSAQVEQLLNRAETNIQNVETTATNNQRRNARSQNNVTYGVDTLVDAGLTTVEAERVLELEAETRNALQELMSDPENRSRETIREVAQNLSSQLRNELGDYGYETYLEATGRPTSVSVNRIDEESAGASAGLQEGDQIVSYGGERVFDISDLQLATESGTEGETVILEVLRDGQSETLVIPRGEIGISTRGRR